MLAGDGRSGVPGACGIDGYLQPFDIGTNILAVVPGTDLADAYIMVGAHYDSVGPDRCRAIGSRDDTICNGATDNAAGAVAAIEVARAITGGDAPRRTLVVALWDAEEDTLAGSRHYISSPAAPLTDTVAYVNFDIHGARLTPSTVAWRAVQGAETGGAPLVNATSAAIAGSDLHYLSFGIAAVQARSDHASSCASASRPCHSETGTNGCYHTVDDELAVVDFDKLAEQIAVAQRLVADLVDTDTPPVRTSARPQPTFEEIEQMLDLFEVIESDVALSRPGRRSAWPRCEPVSQQSPRGPDAFDPSALSDTLRRGFLLEAYVSDLHCAPICVTPTHRSTTRTVGAASSAGIESEVVEVVGEGATDPAVASPEVLGSIHVLPLSILSIGVEIVLQRGGRGPNGAWSDRSIRWRASGRAQRVRRRPVG